jgi:transposase
MKDVSVKKEFIRLRAEGHSLAEISQRLNTSKPILLKWHEEFEKEINNSRFEIFESLIEEHKLAKEHRVKAFGKLLQKLLIELDKRDFSSLSTKELWQLVLSLETKYATEIKEIEYKTDTYSCGIAKKLKLPF